jgi:hypothetical protein
MTEISVLLLQQLYRDMLVELAGADATFVAEMPLDVLSGMFGKQLCSEVARLTFWPSVCASMEAFLHERPQAEPAVLDLFNQVRPLTRELNEAFEDTFLLGIMTDRGIRENGNQYNRALLQLSFKLTGAWSTSNENFMLVRDAVQLLAFAEMMHASHGETVPGWASEVAQTSGDLARLRAYMQLLVRLRELVAGMPPLERPTVSITWLRENVARAQLPWMYRLNQVGSFEHV